MKRQMSDVGKQMLQFQQELARQHNYQPIQPDLFLGDVRDRYRAALPDWCLEAGEDTPLYSLPGTKICTGFKRVVIGDYGAFVECAPEQMVLSSLQCKHGQEYRYLDERFSKTVKYLWLTARDNSDCKIYLQQKRVEYADYIPNMYYVSPYEVTPDTEKER